MFTGEYTHSLDDKGRVAFPRRLRETAGDEAGKEASLFLCRGQGGCLYLYTEKRWRSLVDSMSKPSFGAPDQVNFSRLFFSTASEARLDGQARFQVPDHLRVLAGIDREVVFVGVYD
ncbi:MAG: cell division/cell wall cluster transcriptional repressor MraZ, partial [Planctomycetes bacterium]|nr:cell division/cell wall cluster transcriptional repressor MraZ [Planctomycetota bacterium]